MSTLVDTCSCGAPVSMLPADHICPEQLALDAIKLVRDEARALALEECAKVAVQALAEGPNHVHLIPARIRALANDKGDGR